MHQTEIERLLNTPEEDLFERLGVSDIPALQGVGGDRFTYIEMGRRRLEEKRQQICDKLKQSQLICDFVKGRRICDRVELVSATADIISTILGGLPVLAASTLIVKRGFIELCGEKCFD